MKLSLIITTYERPDALATVLRSVIRQTCMPYEVVVADDGSGESTRLVVEEAAKKLPIIRHAWLPHDGFRAGRMRNHGIANTTGDYVLLVDGDVYLHPDFVKDHIANARPGFFVQGPRALLDEKLTAFAMSQENYWPGFFTRGVKNRKNLIYSPFLSKLYSKPTLSLRRIGTCNLSLWREDVVRVNGFYEGFVGWGREDSEFAARLLNSGVKRFSLHFEALCCHLAHPQRSREQLGTNDLILAETIEKKLTRRDQGLNLHLPTKEERGAEKSVAGSNNTTQN